MIDPVQHVNESWLANMGCHSFIDFEFIIANVSRCRSVTQRPTLACDELQ